MLSQSTAGVDYGSSSGWAPPDSPQMQQPVQQMYPSGELTAQQLYAETQDYFVQDPMLANYDYQYGQMGSQEQAAQPIPEQQVG